MRDVSPTQSTTIEGKEVEMVMARPIDESIYYSSW